MADFGGLGGITGGRERNPEDLFEETISRIFGNRIKSDPEFCANMWSALANVDWTHSNGDTAGYSFRAAGDLIASIRGEGDYMDWYCSGPYATVSREIECGMLAEGWTPETLE
jgi:hypothetical protein